MHLKRLFGIILPVTALIVFPVISRAQPSSGSQPDVGSIPCLKKAIKDADPAVKEKAVLALCKIGQKLQKSDRAKIMTVIPDLVALVGNSKDTTAVREAAASVLADFAACDDMLSQHVADVFLKVLVDENSPSPLRLKTLGLLHVHADLATLDDLCDALEKIADAEPKKGESRQLQYHAVYLLCKYKKEDVSNRVLDVILEWLQDTNSKISAKTASKAMIKDITSGFGEDLPAEALKVGADSRIFALRAVSYLLHGRAGIEKIALRKDLTREFVLLSEDADLHPDVVQVAAILCAYFAPL